MKRMYIQVFNVAYIAILGMFRVVIAVRSLDFLRSEMVANIMIIIKNMVCVIIGSSLFR